MTYCSFLCRRWRTIAQRAEPTLPGAECCFDGAADAHHHGDDGDQGEHVDEEDEDEENCEHEDDKKCFFDTI